MNLTVLGCGDAFGNGGRSNTAFLVSEGREHVLIDCGATTLVRLKHEKVNLELISTIIITHFHGDHYGGLPFFLISSLFENPRKEPLMIVGPEGVKDRIYNLQEAMYKGTAEKLEALDLRFYEYQPETTLRLGDKQIQAWDVIHSEPSNPHAVRLEWKEKVVAFSGDTSWSDNLIPLSNGSDLFICECNFLDSVSFGHLSYEEILDKKELFKTNQLWITHMSGEVIDAKDFKLNRLVDGQKIEF